MYNATLTAKEFIPRDVFCGREGHSFENIPIFGMEVLVNLPQEKLKFGREKNAGAIVTWYLLWVEYRINSFWVNFSQLGHKMKILKAENVHHTGYMDYIVIAEASMNETKDFIVVQP